MRALVVAAVLAAAGTAQADVDWQRGLITEKAYGTADRRAPSPTVARVAAMREAEERAAKALVAAALELPRADGGTVGDTAGGDPAVVTALEAAAAAAIEVKTELLPDGSVRVERALPIESVRQALGGPVPVAGAPTEAPTAIVVDARNLKVPPAVGIAVSDGTTTLELPALFLRKAPGDRDARLGDRPVRVKADSYGGGVLSVSDLTLRDVQGPGVLVIVVIREKK